MHVHAPSLAGYALALAAAAGHPAHGRPGPAQAPRAVLGTATVSLAVPRGTPDHLASGFLYGIPDTPGQIPDHFYTDMGFRYARAGGSQLPAPARGWVYGRDEFDNRFASALSNYHTARRLGARFQLLVADVWGADGTASIAMPGDDGNWTSYDGFLDALFDRMRAGGMVDGVDWETWNEPDLAGVFWQRDQAQYLQMWGRAFSRVRAAWPGMPITGPCTASQPSTTNAWYAQYYPFVRDNGSVPDLYCWHEEAGGGGDDVARDVANNQALLAQYGLPATRPTVLNEYGVAAEQNPGAAAWYMARLERCDTAGLRGNWASGYALHDYLANLLGKPGAQEVCRDSSCNATAGYWPNGEYHVYRYYNRNMTGQRLATVGSPDSLFDVYATVGAEPASGGQAPRTAVKMLCGSRLTSGTWAIRVTGLDAVGLPPAGTVAIQAYQFSFAGGSFGDVPAPVDQGTDPHAYADNELVFSVSLDETTAYALEFVV